MAGVTAKNRDIASGAGANGLGGSSYLYRFGTTPNTRTAVSQKVRLLTPHYGQSPTLNQMGVVSSFNPSQSRTVEPVRGIGFGDVVAELVPSVTEPTTGSFERALLYLCNLWQATGYASGVDGPVRSLAHHRWPFDIEQQLVFSNQADVDLVGGDLANDGKDSTGAGAFDGGIRRTTFPQVTQDPGSNPANGADGKTRGHSAIITMYEGCWFTSWSATFSKDSGMIMESGDVTVSDVHDFSSAYGEFLATGNDPTIGQIGSLRFAEQGLGLITPGGDIGGGGVSLEQSLGL
jgi:hypothetical protein